MVKAEEVRKMTDEVNTKRKLASIARLSEWCANREEQIIEQAHQGFYSTICDAYPTSLNMATEEEHDIIASFFQTYGYSVKFEGLYKFKISWK